MATDWTFGWTQLLTVIGFGIAIYGVRTFGHWKKEKIEEKRIETAIDALALVYESKFIFNHIRSEMAYDYEWKNMPDSYGSAEQRNARGPFYAILKRIEANKDFFERAWKMQVRCTALFGPQMEEIFLLLQRARREIEVSAQMLLQTPEPTDMSQANVNTWNEFRADVWPAYGQIAKHGDKVGKKLSDFKAKMEKPLSADYRSRVWKSASACIADGPCRF
jgi:hypothetical protein